MATKFTPKKLFNRKLKTPFRDSLLTYINHNILIKKKIEILLAIFLILLSNNTFSQWVAQTTGTNDAYYNDVKFFDKDNGIVVSTLGTVYRTNNGGQTWSPVLTGAGIKFAFTDNNTGFVYNLSTLFQTTNKGILWVPFSTDLPAYATLTDMHFPSALIGYAVGATNVFKTTNGGANWTIVKTVSNSLKSVFFINNNVGWIGGRYGDKYQTIDGGLNWTYQGNTGGDYINCLYFINEQKGWGGSTRVITTSNGGTSWSFIGISDIFYVNDIYFTDANNGWAAATSKVLNTTDGGVTWNKITTPSTMARMALSVVDPKNIWVVGTDQMIVTNTKRVQLTYPNGGENILPNSSVNIKFTTYNLANVKLEYSLNNGSTWNTITNSTPSSSGQFAWPTPNNISDQCLIRISNPDDPSLNDVSDNKFTLKGVRIVSPNGSEILTPGSNHTITWIYAGISNVKIEYSYDNSITWNTIIPSIAASSKSFSWPVPNTPSSNCRIKITDTSNSSFNDQSDNLFTIKGVKLLTPSGGENWVIGSKQQISWVTGGITNVKLEYSSNNGTTWQIIEASVSAASQNYNWTIPGTVSSLNIIRISDVTNSAISDISDNVFSVSLGKPILLIPTNNSFNQSLLLILKWNKVTGAQNYQLQVSTDPNFISNIIINLPGITDTVKAIDGLANNTKYYWRVKANNSTGTGEYSSPFNFTTIVAIPTTPNLLTPPSGSKDQPINNLMFTWSSSADASTYHLQISTDFNFSTGLFYNDSTLSITSKTISGLTKNTIYYWRVRAKNIAGRSPWSLISILTTVPPLPSIPILFSPPNNSINQVRQNLKLIWRKSSFATTYQTLVATDVNFQNVFTDRSQPDTLLILNDILSSTDYYWKVRAINSAGSSEFSSILKFTTAISSGIGDLLKNKIFLYPNPAKDIINITGLENESVTIAITSIDGRILNHIHGTGINQINVGDLKKGIYFIRIADPKATATYKLIIGD